jgi:hypothetical protein
MNRFPAMNLARGFLLKACAGAKRKVAHQGDAAESYRRILLTFGDAEMAEQVVSDVIVQECVLRCGSPWRGCGIPADGLCLLAMQGAARPAGQAFRALRRGKQGASPDASIQSC